MWFDFIGLQDYGKMMIMCMRWLLFFHSCDLSFARFSDQLRSDHQVLREIHEELGPVIGHSCLRSNHPAQLVFHQFEELELELAQSCGQISISCRLADYKDVAIMKAEVLQANNYILRNYLEMSEQFVQESHV